MLNQENQVKIKDIDKTMFQQIWLTQNATSIAEYPASPSFMIYRCKVNDFDSRKMFPARAVDAKLRHFLRSFDDGAQSISFSQLLQSEQLRDEMLKERKSRSMGRSRVEPHIITEYCTACGCRVVKDGCKEFLDILYHDQNPDIIVSEVSGADWSQSVYDMRLACSCVS